MEKVYLINTKRTAIGKFLGSFYEMDPVKISAQVVDELYKPNSSMRKDTDCCIVGNVISANMGQGLARNIALTAGLPISSSAYNVNMVCGSGMKAIMNACNEIRLGYAKVAVAGGVEFMSNIPFATNSYIRLGKKFGDFKMVDLMTHDGLTDAFSGVHMGVTAENVAEKYDISRDSQDEYAYLTQQRAISAVDEGKFEQEIVPIELIDWKGNSKIFDKDEFPNRNSSLEKLKSLKPTFIKGEKGTVTAGNTSGINDGAAFCLLASEEYVKKHNITPMYEIVESVSAGCDPQYMGLGPYYAIKKLLDTTQMSFDQIDFFEINEAFAAQVLGSYKLLAKEYNISVDQIIEKTNIWGSGLGLGHPLGATGARLITTLTSVMKEHSAEYGIASLCIGGGQGTALLLRKVN